MEVACRSFDDASYLIEHVNGAIFAMSQSQLDINMFLKRVCQTRAEKPNQIMAALKFSLIHHVMQTYFYCPVLGIVRLVIFLVYEL